MPGLFDVCFVPLKGDRFHFPCHFLVRLGGGVCLGSVFGYFWGGFEFCVSLIGDAGVVGGSGIRIYFV